MSHHIKWFAALLAVVSLTITAHGGQLFELVFIDSQTEAKYGAFPINRALVAKGIDQIKMAGARAVVLKFFYDLPKTPDEDNALAKAISGLPVAVQACMRFARAPSESPTGFNHSARGCSASRDCPGS